MNDLLRQRYEVLLDRYRPPEQFGWLKDLVLVQADLFRNEKRVRDLRPDAVYFLLVNLSEMILVAYAAPLPPPSQPIRGERGPRALQPYSTQALEPRVQEAVAIIFSHLAQIDLDEISSHQMLRAIDVHWGQLAELFWWG